MGGHFHIQILDGTMDEDEVIEEFYDLKADAYDKCVYKAEEMTKPGGSYEHSDFDEVLSSLVTYSDSYATLSGIYSEQIQFDHIEASREHFFGNPPEVEKWGAAIAAKVKLTREEIEREQVDVDHQGYAWAIFSNLAC